MLQIGNPFATRDVASTLALELGTFEAISPSGQIFRIVCARHGYITSFTTVGVPGEWRLVKISNSPRLLKVPFELPD